MHFPMAKHPVLWHDGWDPWRGRQRQPANGYTWPIRRVTFQQSNGWQMDEDMAEQLFAAATMIWPSIFRSATTGRRCRLGIRANINGSQTPLARKWTGDYSWIVTVVPTTNAARDGMARNPEGFAYDVSVVVFYKRVLPDSAQPRSTTADNGADAASLRTSRQAPR